MKEKIAGKDARKRKVNVNGVGRMDGVADQVGKEMDVMEVWELQEWATYVPAKVILWVLNVLSIYIFKAEHIKAAYNSLEFSL